MRTSVFYRLDNENISVLQAGQSEHQCLYRLDSGNISVLQAGQWEHQCFTGWTVRTSEF